MLLFFFLLLSKFFNKLFTSFFILNCTYLIILFQILSHNLYTQLMCICVCVLCVVYVLCVCVVYICSVCAMSKCVLWVCALCVLCVCVCTLVLCAVCVSLCHCCLRPKDNYVVICLLPSLLAFQVSQVARMVVQVPCQMSHLVNLFPFSKVEHKLFLILRA